MDALLQSMFLIGQGSAVKLSKRQKAVLARLGISDSTSLPASWIWMSNSPGRGLTDFHHCFFSEDCPYASDIYARLLGGAV